nr:hypothetical protein [Psychrobacter sp. PraFG1]UNK04589.1 hypothetical protein MN210_09970 [Psychrobacter sp. PraFG1]
MLRSKEYRSSAVDEHNTVVLSKTRIEAINHIAPYYMSVYGDDPEFQKHVKTLL